LGEKMEGMIATLPYAKNTTNLERREGKTPLLP
jgi:hypothetical protein